MTDRMEIGDRIEVVFGSGDIHATGILVAIVQGQCCLYLDPYDDRGHWPGSFRLDQVRIERSPAARLTNTIKSMEKRVTEIIDRRNRRWSRWFWPNRIGPEEAALYVSIEALRGVQSAFWAAALPNRNVASEIITETPDGLKRGDPVQVELPPPAGSQGPGATAQCTFIAEFRGMRWFRFGHGGCHALPKERVRRVAPRSAPKPAGNGGVRRGHRRVG